MTIIALKNISKNFGGVTALENITFSVESGQIVSVIGPNGAGKTTLFNCISGLIPLTSGSIIFKGKDISRLPAHKILSLGIARTFQNIRLFSNMSVIDNVSTALHCKHRYYLLDAMLKGKRFKDVEDKIKHIAMQTLSLIGLDAMATNTASTLAYGHRRRLEIARALACDPDILLLDEPSAGMNIQETEQIMILIKKIQNIGKTILLIEHDMNLVMGISDRVIVLDHGAKIADGKPDEIKNNRDVIEAYLGIEL